MRDFKIIFLPFLRFIYALQIFFVIGCGQVSDLGDQAGIVTEPDPIEFLSENLLPVTPANPYKESVAVSGGVVPITYSILEGELPSGLVLDSVSGLINGTVSRQLAGQRFTFKVRATDALLGYNEKTFQLDVSKYSILIFPEELPTVPPTQTYEIGITLVNPELPVTFTTSGSLPIGLQLETDPENGTARIVSTDGGVGRELSETNYQFGIIVTDSTGMVARRDYTVVVGKAPQLSPLEVTTSAINSPVAGQPYAQILSAQGGQAPYKFRIIAGALLPGLELSESGVISGQVAPASAGQAFAFSVQVEDDLGNKAERGLSATTSSYAFEIVPNQLPEATPTRSYSARIYSIGAIPPVRYSVDGNLPSGLRLDVSNNEAFIVDNGSGVSASLENTVQSFKVVAIDANDVSVSRQFTLTINGTPVVAPLQITTTSISTPAAGSNYAAAISAEGGIAPYIFNIQSGTLVSGLSLSPSGVISGTVPLSAAGTSYSITVRVSDSAGTTQFASFSGVVSTYSYSVVPDLLPPVTPQQPYTARIYTVGAAAPVVYSIAGDFPSGLSLNVASSIATISDVNGGVSSLLQNTVRNFQIIARDANNIVQTVNLSLTIGPAIVTPALSITTSSLHTPVAGDTYIASINVSGGVPPYAYSVVAGAMPSGLNLNSSTGFITGVPAFNTSGTPFVFTLRVTDSLTQETERTYSGTVSTYSLALQPANLPNAFPEAPYSASYSASQGNAPYSYRIFSGSLPNGLNINAVTGVVSGTLEPSASAQTFNFTIEAIDSSNTYIRRSDSITVNNYTTTISAPANPTGNEGVAFSALMSAGGGVSPYTFEYQGSLPSGVGLANTGSFFGTPAPGTGSVAGTDYLVFVRARDSRGYPSAYVPVTIKIGVTAVTLSAGIPAAGVRGAQYSHSVLASGGRSPFTYSLASTSAQLPTGLTLSSAGTISGTPVTTNTCPANPPVLLIAVDALGQVSPSTPICISVDNGIVITTESLPPIIRGQSYGHTLAVSGGNPSYAFTGYGFPSGIGVNSSGVISGITSSTENSVDLYFTVQDSSTPNKLSGSKSFQVPVVDSVTLSTSTLANGAAGRSYSQTLNASGGLAPRTFSITEGTLPPGLSISAAGVISGTIENSAAVNSPYNFKIRATDSLGLSSSEVSFSIPVSIPPRFTSTALTPARQGAPYSASVQFEGGVPPFNFSFPAASPSGITIGNTSGILSSSSVLEAPGTTTFTIRITDSRGITTDQTHALTVASSLSPSARPKIAAPSYSEICPTPRGSTNCGSWHPYAVGQLLHSGAQQNAAFVVYFVGSSTSSNANNALVIARMDETGRIGTLGSVGSTAISEATFQLPIDEFIADVAIADMDNDGLNDIVVSQNSANNIRILWNDGNSADMPLFSMASSNTFSLPAGRVRPRALHIRKLRTQNSSGLDLAVTSDTSFTDVTTNDVYINIFLNTCTAGANCSGSRSSILSSGTAYATTTNANMIAGAATLVSGNFFGSTNGSCPSIATVGRRRGANEHWAFILRQKGTPGNCLGDFSASPGNVYDNARYLVSENTRTSDLAVGDFNNDGIDDLAVVSDLSTNVRIYYMQSNGSGWSSSYSKSVLTSPNYTVPIGVGGTSLNVSKVEVMCLNGASSCSFPSLLVTGGRAAGGVQTSGGAAGNHYGGVYAGFAAVVPNSSGIFDTNGLNVNYYAAPPGQVSPPRLFPVVGSAPTLRDLVLLGTSTDNIRGVTGSANMGVPFLMTLPRNGSSTSDPFKANSFNNGVATNRRVALRSYPDEFFYNEDTGSAVVRDFDGDGFSDIASHLVSAASVTLSRGTGDARTTFSQAENFPVGVQHGLPMNLSPQTMESGDFNNDGKPDLAVVGWTSRSIGVLRTVSSGTVFSTTPDVYTAGAGDSRPIALKVFDADGDGKLDIVFSKLRFNFPSTGSNTAYLSLLKGKGDGTFLEATDLASGLETGCPSDYIRKIEAVDLDADGRPEIFALCRGATASISVLRRHTDGSWKKNNSSPPITAPSGFGMDFVVGQLFPGGSCSYGKNYCVDVALSVNLISGSPFDTIRLYGRVTMDTPTGSGSFNVLATSASAVNISAQAANLVLGDFNLDGNLDLGGALISHSGGGSNAVIATPPGAFGTNEVSGFAFLVAEGDGLGGLVRQSMFGGQNAGMSNLVVGHLNNTVDSILDFVATHRVHAGLGGRGRLPDNAAIFNYLGEN